MSYRKLPVLAVALGGVCLFSAESGPVTLKAIPSELHWNVRPASFSVQGDDALEIVAPRMTDRFTSPLGDTATHGAPWLLFDSAGDFVLDAKVTVGFRSFWDAGTLVIHADDRHWAKLCFEYSAKKQPTIVSVVTRGISDDSNAIPIDGNAVYLQIARLGHGFVFYASKDGRSWQVIRAFTLTDSAWESPAKLRVGFGSQSPSGEGCRTVFSEIRYRAGRVKDWASGD
jgi:regulation of enolase protein 1 (concanavalin A-like superfamily)